MRRRRQAFRLLGTLFRYLPTYPCTYELGDLALGAPAWRRPLLTTGAAENLSGTVGKKNEKITSSLADCRVMIDAADANICDSRGDMTRCGVAAGSSRQHADVDLPRARWEQRNLYG